MAFFWKFTRSGRISNSYVSLIIDATPDVVNQDMLVWHTSFEEIGMCLILLHDVEVSNVPSLGPTKPAFRDVVRQIGYEPSREYRAQRLNMALVKGQCVMGRHEGVGLDWGYYSNKSTPITLSLKDLEVSAFIDAKDGKLWRDGEDKLSCFRGDPNFVLNGRYYDLMPKHIVMIPLAKCLLETDVPRAENFFSNILKWSKLAMQ